MLKKYIAAAKVGSGDRAERAELIVVVPLTQGRLWSLQVTSIWESEKPFKRFIGLVYTGHKVPRQGKTKA